MSEKNKYTPEEAMRLLRDYAAGSAIAGNGQRYAEFGAVADCIAGLVKDRDGWEVAARKNADTCIEISKDLAAVTACHDERKARAEKAEDEAAALREDKARLDWVRVNLGIIAATSPEIPAASPVSRFVLDEDSDFVCDRLKAEDESGRWLTTAREVFEAFDDAGGNPKVVSAHPVSGDEEAAR